MAHGGLPRHRGCDRDLERAHPRGLPPGAGFAPCSASLHRGRASGAARLALGMPFPLGLRYVVQRSAALGAWAWAVNGFFTVLGTVLALMLGMMAGFVAVMFVSCVCYGCGLVALTLSSVTELAPGNAQELVT